MSDLSLSRKTEIYFGATIPPYPKPSPDWRACPDYVKVEYFEHFLETVVSLEFPGFTVTTGIGYWEGEPETVRIVTIVHGNLPKDLDRIDLITQTYKTRFRQDSVLVVSDTVEGRLI